MQETPPWPEGKRMPVVFNIAYEAWSPSGSPAIGPMGNPLPSGLADTQAASWGAYGSKRGIWRLIDLFYRHGVQATVFASACLAERSPESLKRLAQDGHEVCGHGYTQDDLPPSHTEEEERELIQHCTYLLSTATGKRPVGWVSPRGTPSENTHRLLAESGFAWHGDSFDEDLPYIQTFGEHQIIAIPLTMELNDLPLYVRHGNPPRAMLETFQDTFHWLYHQESSPGHIDVTVHAHVFGRPYGAWVLDEILRTVVGYPDVWTTTRARLAEWVLSREGITG